MSADLLNQEGFEAEIGEGAGYQIEGPGAARPQTTEAIARKLGECSCPALMFGDDVWNQNAQDEAVHLAELLGAPVSAAGRPVPTFQRTTRCIVVAIRWKRSLPR